MLILMIKSILLITTALLLWKMLTSVLRTLFKHLKIAIFALEIVQL